MKPLDQARGRERLFEDAFDRRAHGVAGDENGADHGDVQFRPERFGLARKLGTKVEVRDKDGKGELAIKYASWDELDKLLEMLL